MLKCFLTGGVAWAQLLPRWIQRSKTAWRAVTLWSCNWSENLFGLWTAFNGEFFGRSLRSQVRKSFATAVSSTDPLIFPIPTSHPQRRVKNKLWSWVEMSCDYMEPPIAKKTKQAFTARLQGRNDRDDWWLQCRASGRGITTCLWRGLCRATTGRGFNLQSVAYIVAAESHQYTFVSCA